MAPSHLMLMVSGSLLYFDELKDQAVAVVATDKYGQIASWSARCGVVADHCIAAPGKDIWHAWVGPCDDKPDKPCSWWETEDGTSYAAPWVTGTLALMKEVAGEKLSNQQLLSILFETAEDSGRYSDRKIYGHGLLNVEAALAEVEWRVR